MRDHIFPLLILINTNLLLHKENKANSFHLKTCYLNFLAFIRAYLSCELNLVDFI